MAERLLEYQLERIKVIVTPRAVRKAYERAIKEDPERLVYLLDLYNFNPDVIREYSKKRGCSDLGECLLEIIGETASILDRSISNS